jgi:hypothetical protein
MCQFLKLDSKAVPAGETLNSEYASCRRGQVQRLFGGLPKARALTDPP